MRSFFPGTFADCVGLFVEVLGPRLSEIVDP